MDDHEDGLRAARKAEPEPFQISWIYAIPSFFASLFVCSLIYEILPYLWGLRDVLMTLVPVVITIATVNEIERNSHRQRRR